MQLGPHIRNARRRRGWTIAALATASGLSKGFVSQVENDKTSPSLDTLERLAAALEVSLVDLLRGAGEPAPLPHVVRAALQAGAAPGPGRRLTSGRLLAPGVQPAQPTVREITPPGTVLRSFVIELPPGATLGEPGHRHDGDETVVVLAGAVEAVQGDGATRLGAGDALTWTAGQAHRLLNRSPEPVRLLITLLAPAALGAIGRLGSPAGRPVAPPRESRPLRLVQMRAERDRRLAQ